MPRAVFKLLWDTIKAGEPIAAYVKNMAANGNYYKDFMIQAAFAELSSLQEKGHGQQRDHSATGVLRDITELGFRASEDLLDCFTKVQGFQEKNHRFLRTIQE